MDHKVLRRFGVAVFTLGFSLTSLSLLNSPSTAGEKDKMKPTQTSTNAKTDGKQKLTRIELHPLTQQIFREGAISCVARYDTMIKFIGRGKSVYVMQKTKRPVAESMLVTSAAGKTSANEGYIGAFAAAPTSAGGCDGSYQFISYRKPSCKQVMKTDFKDRKAATLVKDTISVIGLTATARVFLMNAGSGCVVLQQEVLY